MISYFDSSVILSELLVEREEPDVVNGNTIQPNVLIPCLPEEIPEAVDDNTPHQIHAERVHDMV